ncbi:N-acetyltransferase [Acidiferrobacter thiooxydans]|jgi:amino-acid N-acetyltransferase|uniref:GNAT family N-acetyltransferase n=2 Tax=Acidiferrobacter thiooxydans TaxID=163359 RepID=A0A1C2FXF7_9GAMM|nr:N-acetyltransferase [Acidiferrobacter thiooxydans]RCN56509.1 GNAT family N-acetyltransferase [Acidiferrobacter thiooxydans]UEN99151.1 N-acetyltransferase [Acidiferrobacter thiooxydans]
MAAPKVRPARIADVPLIHHFLELYATKGNLLPRTMNEIYRHLRDFFVIEVDERVVAIGALEIFTEDLGEVRSLVVAEEYERRGLGRLMVQRIIAEARQLGLRRLMALTYVPAFFHKLGFVTVAMDTLPEKVWNVCVKCYKYNRCDETAVLLNLGRHS